MLILYIVIILIGPSYVWAWYLGFKRGFRDGYKRAQSDMAENDAERTTVHFELSPHNVEALKQIRFDPTESKGDALRAHRREGLDRLEEL